MNFDRFEIYEALLWEPPRGYLLLDLHLARMARAAANFGFAFDAGEARSRLEALATELPDEARKVRLELSRDGSIWLEHQTPKPSSPVLLALGDRPVASDDVFLQHKTSRRETYQRALASHPEAGDVLLWNQRRELTECCAANIVLEIDSRRLTPAASSGLLPGTYRAHLLARGEIEEAVLPIAALARATRLFAINSVRRWCDAHLITELTPRS
ncbi:MAG: hypothetical protein GY725_01220 [bacterium]|nr:hypothetical protein [bacterium]